MPAMFRSVTEAAKRGWDRLRRRIAIWVWDKPASRKNRANDANNRIVFVRWDAKLGDTIVLSWVLRELQCQRPDLQITVITADSFKELFVEGYGITSVFVAGKRHGWQALSDIAKQIAHPKYVVHLSLYWRPRDIRFVQKLAPEHVVGLDDELKLVDIKLGQRTRGCHFSEKLVPWLEQLGVDTTNRQYWVPRLPKAREQVHAWWPEGRVIGLCPYGASRKKCLNDQWIRYLVEICLNGDFKVLMLVLPDQRAHIESLVRSNNWGDRVVLNPGQSSQFALFEQVARCQAVVSVDTAVVHLAIGLGKPLLAIYNSAGQEFDSWHPGDEDALVVRTNHERDVTVNALDEMELSRALARLFEEKVA